MGEEVKKIASLKHFKNSILTFSIEVKKSNRQGKSDFLQGFNRVKFDNLATIMDPMGFKWPKLMIYYIKVWCQKLPVPKIYKLPPALSVKDLPGYPKVHFLQESSTSDF